MLDQEDLQHILHQLEQSDIQPRGDMRERNARANPFFKNQPEQRHRSSQQQEPRQNAQPRQNEQELPYDAPPLRNDRIFSYKNSLPNIQKDNQLLQQARHDENINEFYQQK